MTNRGIVLFIIYFIVMLFIAPMFAEAQFAWFTGADSDIVLSVTREEDSMESGQGYTITANNSTLADNMSLSIALTTSINNCRAKVIPMAGADAMLYIRADNSGVNSLTLSGTGVDYTPVNRNQDLSVTTSMTASVGELNDLTQADNGTLLGQIFIPDGSNNAVDDRILDSSRRHLWELKNISGSTDDFGLRVILSEKN